MKGLRIAGVVLMASLFFVTSASSSADYHFGPGSFTNEMWVAYSSYIGKMGSLEASHGFFSDWRRLRPDDRSQA